MKKSTIIILCLLFGALIYACNKQPAKDNTSNNVVSKQGDSVETNCATEETIMDPNGAKPMALMMRQMVLNAQLMREKIIRNEKLDSLKYPFIRFYLVEPTDPKVLEPQFYENARLFQEAYFELFNHPAEQTKFYNLAIGKCISCHENYCSGPLKRIRKLLIQ